MRRAFPLLAAVVALAGCAALTVSSHAERGLHMGAYRTFDWGPADALPTGDPRLDGNPLFKDRLQGAVEKGLAARGIDRVLARPSDLLIHYHAHVTDRLAIDSRDRAYGYCAGAPCAGAQVVEYEAGTLVLDIVDTRTNRVIWRGWAQTRLGEMLDDPDRMAATIAEAVDRMLDRLPTEPEGRAGGR